MNDSPVTIRRAGPEDAAAALTLLRELAAHQDQLRHVAVSEERMRELLCREDVIVLLAERGGRPIGFVSVVRHLNIWAGRDILALDDLFVRPEARDGGVGRLLMTGVAGIAAAEGMVVRWEVLKDNEGAQRFYTRLGATLSTKIVAAWPPGAYAAHVGGRA